MNRRLKGISFLYLALCSAVASATLPPPQGKSIRTDSDYGINDQNYSWSDLQGRWERRTKLIEENKNQEIEAKPVAKKRATKALKKPSAPHRDQIRISQAQVAAPDSNLPRYYQGIDRSEMKSSDRVVFVPQNGSVKLRGVRSGDQFYAVVEQRIKASPSVPTPIRAMVTSGKLKGGFFVGEATLDRELKRILLTFSRVRSVDGKTFVIKATGLATDGSIGLEGEYHSQAGTFFVAELASATAAGFLDSTINRNQNGLGNYVQEPSVQNSAKSGAVTALLRSADRMAEQARQAPEFTEIAGYQNIHVIVQDDPVELN